MSTGITVTFGTIQQAQSDVSQSVSRIDGQLNDLRQFLSPMISSWEGGASTDYQALQRRWDSAASDLNAVLQQISQMLGTTHQSYTSTESSNAGAWG
jgi:6 kDa early secretory antigenic target